MPEIQIIAKDNHKTLVTTEGTSAKLSEASVVLVKVAASDVLVVNREGTNAVIRLKNGETIVIEGFFSGTAEPKDNSLVFQDENGQLIWAKFKDAENDADADSDADADADSDVEPQALLGEDLPAALPAEAPQEWSGGIFRLQKTAQALVRTYCSPCFRPSRRNYFIYIIWP